MNNKHSSPYGAVSDHYRNPNQETVPVMTDALKELVLLARAGKLDWLQLTSVQKLELDLYAAQGGFRGTGLSTL